LAVFTNIRNCDVSEDTIIETTGNPAEAYSTDPFAAGNAVLEFKVHYDESIDLLIGFNPAPTGDYSYLDEAWYISSGEAKPYSSGPGSPSYQYNSATVFKMVYAGTIIQYYMDNVLIRTSVVTADQVFYADFETNEYSSYIGECVTDILMYAASLFRECVEFDSLITTLVSFNSLLTIEDSFDSEITKILAFDSSLED